MKKITVILLSVLVLFPLHSLELESGLSFNGGVKTGILIRNRDFGGRLGNLALNPDEKYPMTLHFASYENQARNGEAWLNVTYSREIESFGTFGLGLGLWAHGDIHTFDDTLHLGDHYLWANFFNDRLRFIGGQGGGAPISSGGWINADWLSYTGLRIFWVDDSLGLSFGIKFPDPQEEGIKPVNYLSMLGIGASFKQDNWQVSLQFDNNPIYDDTYSNYYGGLHRPAEQDPIGQAGNIAFGVGLENLYSGKGFLVFEGLFSNLGEDPREPMGNGRYTVSPLTTTFAVKTGLPLTEQFFAEFKGKYTISRGHPTDFDTAESSATWGKLELEPYASFQPLDHLRFDLSVNFAYYINSYYLALDSSPSTIMFDAGQVPGYGPLLDYLSPYQIAVKPRVSFKLSGIDIDLGYTGYFSRDHVENIMYLDFRMMF